MFAFTLITDIVNSGYEFIQKELESSDKQVTKQRILYKKFIKN